MDLQVLNNELSVDPLGRGYAGMTDTEAAADLNTVYRTIQLATLNSAQVYEQIVPSEFQALTDIQRSYVRDILGLGEGIDASVGSQARTVMVSVFGAESGTITNLAEALEQDVSRAVELGLGAVTPGDITAARAYGSV